MSVSNLDILVAKNSASHLIDLLPENIASYLLSFLAKMFTKSKPFWKAFKNKKLLH